MKIKTLILIISLCVAGGFLFFLIQRQWLIIQFAYTSPTKEISMVNGKNVSNKVINFFYWKNNRWHQEEGSVVWDEHHQENTLQQIIKQWLTIMHNEQLIPPNCVLESAMVPSNGNDAYISFDRSLLFAEQSIIKKWYVIEGLFKTLNDAGLPIHTIMFLVHNQPMNDEHIEFSQPLPVHERL